jgi:hypothetical protein
MAWRSVMAAAGSVAKASENGGGIGESVKIETRRAKAKAAIEMAKWRHQHGGLRENENGESSNVA